jgi:hypothetical protein
MDAMLRLIGYVEVHVMTSFPFSLLVGCFGPFLSSLFAGCLAVLPSDK